MPKKKIVKKSEHDKFYTKPEVAKTCIDVVTKMFNGTYVEPSAGAGSFSKQLECIAYDLVPEGEGIVKADFLTTNLSTLGGVCVIGNPPFGNRNKLTNQFIKHSISFDNVSVVAFILPESFSKLSMQKVFPTEWRLVHTHKLPDNSFTLEREDYHVPCVFQVWEKDSNKEDKRERKCLPICKDFEIVVPARRGEADFFSFGASPTKIVDVTEVQKNNRGYYIKSLIDKEELKDKIRDVDWNSIGASSVSGGVFWVGKDEYIKYYCGFYGEEIHYVN